MKMFKETIDLTDFSIKLVLSASIFTDTSAGMICHISKTHLDNSYIIHKPYPVNYHSIF